MSRKYHKLPPIPARKCGNCADEIVKHEQEPWSRYGKRRFCSIRCGAKARFRREGKIAGNGGTKTARKNNMCKRGHEVVGDNARLTKQHAVTGRKYYSCRTCELALNVARREALPKKEINKSKMARLYPDE